jgi:site-specific DNA-methyltransferase (adenine-specific)
LEDDTQFVERNKTRYQQEHQNQVAREQLPLGFMQVVEELLVPSMAEVTDLPFQPTIMTSRGLLFTDDCLKILRKIRSESVHCVFADPPFNLNKDYGIDLDDDLSEQDYLDWSYAWIDECCRILAPGGSLFIYNIPKWLIYFGHFLMSRLDFRHWIAMTMKNTFPRGRKLYPAHYGILYFTKGEPRVFHKLRTPIPVCRHCGGEIKDYGGHRDKLNERGLSLTDFWEDTSPVRHSKYKTRVANELKPRIPERAIRMSTNPGDIVLDPFGGGGTTYQVAEEYDRYWIGMEIGAFAPIVERLQFRPGVELGALCPLEVRDCFLPA